MKCTNYQLQGTLNDGTGLSGKQNTLKCNVLEKFQPADLHLKF